MKSQASLLRIAMLHEALSLHSRAAKKDTTSLFPSSSGSSFLDYSHRFTGRLSKTLVLFCGLHGQLPNPGSGGFVFIQGFPLTLDTSLHSPILEHLIKSFVLYMKSHFVSLLQTNVESLRLYAFYAPHEKDL